MRPELSIVIPTFRRPALLRETLESVVAQEDVALEVFVVDDSPEGSAAEIVKEIGDPRISYLKNPTPSGGIPSLVRNIGLQRCRGVYVHFLDDDDVIPEGFYDPIRAELKGAGQAGMMFGRIEPFGDCPAEQLAREKAFFQEALRRARLCARLGAALPFVGQMLFGQVLLVCSAAILRRDCIQDVGGFDPNIVLHEDRDLFIRLMRKHGVRFFESLCIRYRIGYPSLMHASAPSPEQVKLEREGNRQLKQKYLKTYGSLEYYSLAVATKTMNGLILRS